MKNEDLAFMVGGSKIVKLVTEEGKEYSMSEDGFSFIEVDSSIDLEKIERFLPQKFVSKKD